MQIGSLVISTNALGIVQELNGRKATVLLKTGVTAKIPVKQLTEVINPHAQANLLQYNLVHGGAKQ